ncbi:hypothetical protein [Xanthomonas euroxanthea]|uniref:hypothetical protein n=1 Tax=Xanthomonas euroxanthea TaxID=2259622 RepID=UPI0016191E33|nr:hypothetical protein [Xanthomonas euroxanthea]MBB5765978.1 hypothetical protein [Xanthomonas euroxanthea]
MRVVEWAEFGLKSGISETELLQAAARMQQGFLAAQAGYVSRQLLVLGQGRYADQIVWQSHDAASAAMVDAAENVACRDYFALMHVDARPALGTPILSHRNMSDSPGGIEFSLFRLRPNVDEHTLAKAARQMAADLYDGEPGFQMHMVMRSDADKQLFADVVLADSAERARALCGKWGQGPFHPACVDYLNLIASDSVRLEFWDRLT